MRRFVIRGSDAPPMRDPMTLTGALVRLVLGIGAYLCLLLWGLHHRDEPAALITLVVCAPLVIPLVVPGLLGFFPALWRLGGERALGSWHGRYFEFEGRQIHIEVIGGKVWVALDDVRVAAALSVHDPELTRQGDDAYCALREVRMRAIADVALMDLLLRRRSAQAARFRRWLQRDVLPPLYRRAQGSRPVPPTFEQNAGHKS